MLRQKIKSNPTSASIGRSKMWSIGNLDETWRVGCDMIRGILSQLSNVEQRLEVQHSCCSKG